MPKFTNEQLRGWSEYEEGQNADEEATNPYDGRTNAGKAWKLGHQEAYDPASEEGFLIDPVLEAIRGDIREANPDPESQTKPLKAMTDPRWHPQAEKPAHEPTLSDFTSAELTQELERRGVPLYERDALSTELERNQEIKRNLTDAGTPKCLLHPGSLVRRQGRHWWCSGGHPFETPGIETPETLEGPIECPEHAGYLLDRISMQGDSTLYYCGQGQHHVRLDNDGAQLTLSNPAKKGFE